jgi:hypothetical protein
MAGEFTANTQIAALENARDFLLLQAEKDYQKAVGSGTDPTTAQATRQTTVNAALAAHTAAVARTARK